MSPNTPRIFNSLRGAVEPLKLSSPVGIYVCGITPYDAMHLGHAFTYTLFDVLVRLLRFLDYDVTYIQNVTDVDDDVLRQARKLGVDWKDLGQREVEKFLTYSDRINNLRPDVMPLASEHIPEIQDFVASLLKQAVAYERNGHVYFDVAAAPSFGKRLLRRPYADQLALANEHGNYPDDPLKRDPLDFVLWQASAPGEPAWESPWGRGRPGWHIECSAMSRRYLGESFAIHGGGSDLLFPHHECEIAQSEHVNGKGALLARYWIHTAMVHQDGQKMSKSLGNMTFVSDLLASYSPLAIRLALLSHHYREEWSVTTEQFSSAEKLGQRLKTWLDSVEMPEVYESSSQQEEELILATLLDDLDTPQAIDVLSSLASSQAATTRALAKRLGERLLGLNWD